MTPHLIIVLSLPALLAVAWAIGRFHISLVDPQEVGKLTPERFTQRLVAYGTPLAALFAVFGAFSKSVDELAGVARVLFIACVAVAGMFALVVLTGSYLEVSWYRSETLPPASRRRRVFEAACLPVLYSALYLYWFALIPAWFLLVAVVLKARSSS